MPNQTEQQTQASYDQVAHIYHGKFANEFDHKPFDRARLDAFAALVRDNGPVCDLGCGPGHLADYLHQQGIDVTGIDLSPEMVKTAQAAFPGIQYAVGSMYQLAADDNSYAGIAAFYSLIHIPRADMVGVLRELLRVLMPGGYLLFTFHIGAEVVHLDDWWDQPVSVDFHLYKTSEMIAYLEQTAFKLIELRERDCYPGGVEAETRRAYVLVQKPA